MPLPGLSREAKNLMAITEWWWTSIFSSVMFPTLRIRVHDGFR
jgi:hypothetical protein